MTMTTETTPLYQACAHLFADYPLAVETFEAEGDLDAESRMVLILPGPDPEFFVLTRFDDDRPPQYRVHPWKGQGGTDISTVSAGVVPDDVAQVIAEGVPLPRDGSLFGWLDQGTVVALICVYAGPDIEQPQFSTMPRIGTPEATWTAATQPLFGSWFWDCCREGRLVNLAPFVGGTQNFVFWVDTIATLGSSVAAVEMDLSAPDGWVLPHGVYAHYPLIKAGKSVPSLDALLADPGKVDLGPRFRAVGT
jgi:hypothetical protein